MPKVSIVIPLHNAENFILETLSSCLRQTYQQIEILVIENGSKDKSYERVAALNEPRLQLHKIGAANAAMARNFGLSKATGDYLMFLDADDILAPNKIEAQLNALQHHPDDWIASCAWAKFVSDIREAIPVDQPVWEVQNPVEWMIESLTGGGMMIPSCWLIPRSLIDQAGPWDERLTLHDDGEFMCRVLLASRGQVLVENTLVYYRQVNGSLSRQNKSFQAAQSALRVCQSYHKHLLEVEDNEKVRFALAHAYRSLIYEFYQTHSQIIEEAKKSLLELGINPLPIVGSANFKKLSNIVGFESALRISGMIRKLRNLKS